MKLRTFLSTTLLAASAAAQVDEVRKDDNREPLSRQLQYLDTNEDGMIDEEENQASLEYRLLLRKKRRNSIDSNDDGIISQDEIAAARKVLRKLIKARRVERFKSLAGEDELISAEEFLSHPALSSLPEETAQAIFVRLDADESGDVTTAEFLARLRSHEAPAK